MLISEKEFSKGQDGNKSGIDTLNVNDSLENASKLADNCPIPEKILVGMVNNKPPVIIVENPYSTESTTENYENGYDILEEIDPESILNESLAELVPLFEMIEQKYQQESSSDNSQSVNNIIEFKEKNTEPVKKQVKNKSKRSDKPDNVDTVEIPVNFNDKTEENIFQTVKRVMPPPPPESQVPPPRPVEDKITKMENFEPKFNKVRSLKKSDKTIEIIPDKPALNIAATSRYTIEDIRGMNIDENGIFLGIVIGRTTRDEAIKILSEYSTKNFNNEEGAKSMLVFDDIAVILYLNNKNTVEALEFCQDFTGKTVRGLKIGDNLDKAIRMYGPPKMSSTKGAFWDELKVFFDSSEVVSSIKIQA